MPVILLWLGLIGVLGAGAMSAGSRYTFESDMPDTESSIAASLLAREAPAASGTGGTVVWRVSEGSVRDASVKERMRSALERISQAPGVASVAGPYNPRGAAQVSPDGRTAYAAVTFSASGEDLAGEDVRRVEGIAAGARTDGLEVELGGQAFQGGFALSHSSEIIGIGAALVVLLLMFRSAWAAVLPVLTAGAGVGTALFAVILLSHVMNLPETTPTLGALIGLGVGIDYALFIVDRHRRALMAGMDVARATEKAVTTSGRAVVFAGLTVMVALLGMFTLGIGILNGMALGAAITVALTVLAAVTLLPAVLGVLGTRVLGRAQRRALAQGRLERSHEPTGRWARWAGLVQARPGPTAAVALVLIGLVVLPGLSMRLGAADAGNDPASSSSRKAYDMLAEGFGPGFNGPLLLVAQAPAAQDRARFGALAEDLGSVEGVARVDAAPMLPGRDLGVITVVPDGSPQSEETAELIDRLRQDVVPRAERGSGLQVYVGGVTAANADFASVLIGKLPLFIGVIVVLGFLLLVLAFRSLLVPAIGAVMNLLTIGAALGAIVVVFQHGFGSELLGAGSAGPVEAIVPVMVVGVMFGLSMDYQVFLVSRMHEEWTRTRDNRRAVRVGQADTARVITVAATIMFCVFAAFAGGGMRMIAQFGVGFAVAVVLDALLLRMMLVPALMHLTGRANWWLPGLLDRRLPHFSVEGGEDAEHGLPAGERKEITSSVG